MKELDRQSNFELLRIVAMSMVIIGHFMVRALWGGGIISDNLDNFGGHIQILIYGFVCVAVNLFVLVSGYFGIKLSLRTIIRFYLLCIFYNIFAFFINSANGEFCFHNLIKSFFVTKTDNWFFPEYWWLLFIAPLLNKCMEDLQLPQHRLIALITFLIHVLSGYILQTGNNNGYNVLQLLMIYVLGSYIRKENINFGKLKCFIVYVLSSLIPVFICILTIHYTEGKNCFKLFYYNNPFVIIASCALFVFFKQIHIKSHLINTIARSAVAVLLLQDVVFRELMVAFLKSAYNTSWGQYIFLCTLFFIFFFVSAFIMESIRRPIADKITEVVYNFCPEFIKSLNIK